MTKTKTTTVRGLRDGQYTAGTGLLTRKIKALGAKVTVAATGRVTVIDKAGGRHVYVLVHDAAINTSPLAQALADLENTMLVASGDEHAWVCPRCSERVRRDPGDDGMLGCPKCGAWMQRTTTEVPAQNATETALERKLRLLEDRVEHLERELRDERVARRDADDRIWQTAIGNTHGYRP